MAEVTNGLSPFSATTFFANVVLVNVNADHIRLALQRRFPPRR